MNLSKVSNVPQLRGDRPGIPNQLLLLDRSGEYGQWEYSLNVWPTQGTMNVVGELGAERGYVGVPTACRKKVCPSIKHLGSSKEWESSIEDLAPASPVLCSPAPLTHCAPVPWPSFWPSAIPSLFLPQGLCLEPSSPWDLRGSLFFGLSHYLLLTSYCLPKGIPLPPPVLCYTCSSLFSSRQLWHICEVPLFRNWVTYQESYLPWLSSPWYLQA